MILFYQEVDIEPGQDKHFKVLVAMEKHVKKKSVLVCVKRKCEHLKEFSEIDAEPRKWFRVG